jgi:inositol-hexakisphosphate 5-kinase
LLVYEGRDVEFERYDAMNQYDGDISNCSTDLNASSHDDLRHNCSSNDENDAEINFESSNHCLDEEARDSGTSEDKDEKYLKSETQPNRPISPHSMDSWINYSSDEFSSSQQDVIVRKGTKLKLHDDESTQDNDDVDVYDKINFVNSNTTYKKSKIEETNLASSSNPFNFSSTANVATPLMSPTSQSETIKNNRTSHDTDDGIEVELEEEEDDDQLSSLSSNIDTIIVSDTGETKYFNASGEEQEDHPTLKKKKSTNADDDEDKKNLQLNNNVTKGNHSKVSTSSLVDVRIIDFAHTTFTTQENEKITSTSNFNTNNHTKKVHHGPDGGFLTGIGSLKRILGEILAENSIQ